MQKYIYYLPIILLDMLRRVSQKVAAISVKRSEQINDGQDTPKNWFAYLVNEDRNQRWIQIQKEQVSIFFAFLPIFLSNIININRVNFSTTDDRLKILGVNGIGIKDQNK